MGEEKEVIRRIKDACRATTDAMHVVVDSHLPVGITAIHPPRTQHPPEARQSLASRSQVAGFGCVPRAKVPSSTGTDQRERDVRCRNEQDASHGKGLWDGPGSGSRFRSRLGR
ncbi:hypothetical protein CMUS01_05993 [Colletotrichum musicola]|uniref:Uncharacterized protein n=1 Tax=Colletotrichum musicola TaxID=2175873 RepID=A0A8H6NII6_9PEZI|nr:hypothetical protein CMUS01_05993 [Colletotrichum musicola]